MTRMPREIGGKGKKRRKERYTRRKGSTEGWRKKRKREPKRKDKKIASVEQIKGNCGME